ncbi:UDP-N-acetylglucosamine 4,6-dehydratase (configuration-retaining) [Campylobacter fetus]|uniref:UDP-N-acetylglucosamine 4,6-dehydratase (configuration-retaining) n=2 Tax=Campylobacter fetus TaxID=196 RepID=UPI0003C26C7D|nr:UDP-N-acetylglucosamine 4,6-dehydratase (configuration-retaining) [Campylobacter fetus]AGZ82165.1 UDP-N-acetylglucosamine C-6 dehydratase [Campylobacter fetus subsp. testudinum 03-427]EAI4322196.1 UDP-N-acetylglucosamine 4,6-dehydratase (configuration-retaining) [Campylobacter fetus]EAI4391830.1 UDP-N-acetylglucosamine 4,6-dehydratase (configuration-retaining) [Campylobacter fetus]UEA65810.1 UDP-N-acetylglucosamine 4,6-dehydratase (configuration-retaining) [Campylobacter fetus subsp. testudi
MIFRATKNRRTIFFLVFDTIIFCLSIYFAFLLRFSGEIPEIFERGMIYSGIILVSSKLVLMWIFRLYKVPWRFFGLNEARKIFLVTILSAGIFYTIFISYDEFFNPFPRSVIIIDAILSALMVGGLRIVKRIFLDFKKSHNGEPCVIIGSTSKTLQVLKGLKSGYADYYATGIVDGRSDVVGTYCDGFLVGNKSELKNYVEDGVKTAIIALKLRPNELKELYDELDKIGFKDIKIFSLLDGKKEGITDISIEDLLARKPKDLDSKVVEKFIGGKVVMVTGAGGTIGSEICKQCLKYGCKNLIMVEHSEYNLYQINEATKSDPRNRLVMLNIMHLKEFEEVFSKFKPDIVIHAAAYKHVPLCEFNPISAVQNNILGTKNVVDLSKKYGAKRVVLISTDKAVRPTNIMGTTKRVCELYALNSNESGKTEIVAVRFGNVLGSSGSVIPKFKAQIAANEPLSVTHPDITRYFMLVSEACQLVLQAASIAEGGELFVLNMGEPVKIADLAARMLKLSGKENLGIKFVGLRPGEKLYEELLIDPDDAATKFESIFVTKSAEYDLNLLNSQINKLVNLEDETLIEVELKNIVPEFHHSLNRD